MQPSRRPAALLVAALIVACGATLFGLRSRRAPPEEAPASGAPLGPPPSSPASASAAVEAPSRSGLDLVNSDRSYDAHSEEIFPMCSRMAVPGDCTKDADMSAAISVTDRLRAALALQGTAGLGEPAFDPAAATPGERFTAEEARSNGREGRAASRGEASGASRSPTLSEPSAGDAAPLPPPAPTPAGILLAMFKPAERGRLMQQLEGGKGLVSACKTSGLSAQCMAAGQACARYPNCQRWLSGQLTASTRSKAGEAAGGGGEQVTGRGAQTSGQGGDESESRPAGRTAGAPARGGARPLIAAAKPAAEPAAPSPAPSAAPSPTPSPRPTPRPPILFDRPSRNFKLQLE